MSNNLFAQKIAPINGGEEIEKGGGEGGAVLTVISPLRFPPGFAGLHDVTIVPPFGRGAAVFSLKNGLPLTPIFYLVVQSSVEICMDGKSGEKCGIITDFTYGGPETTDAAGNATVSVGAKLTTTPDMPGGVPYSAVLTLAVSYESMY